MQNFYVKAIIERIKLLRKQYAGSRGKSQFARALGISSSTYSYYEASRVPPIETLLKMCEVTGADLNWLLAGKSTRKTPAPESDGALVSGPNALLLQRLEFLLGENPDLAEPISAFIELLCEKKGVEKRLDSKAAGQLPSGKPSAASSGRSGWIPVLGRTAAGMVHFWDQTSLPQPRQAVTELDELVKKHIGKTIIGSAGATVSVDLQARALVDSLKGKTANLIQVSGQEADQIVEFVQCEEAFQLFPDSFALRIDGDSMSPRINDGDIVILSPSVPAVQGQIGVARIANQIGVTCKLVRSTEKDVHLIPINERYEAKVVAKKDLLWSLAVLCHIGVQS